MEIILLERVDKLGQMGEVVRVRDGFARNYLLPQGKALRASKANMARFEKERVQLEARNLEQRKEAEGVAARMTDFSVTLLRQAGESGQLYGSVTARDVADAAIEGGASLGRQQVRLDRPIKTLGLHAVRVDLHPEVSIEIQVNVARTAEEAEIQAAGGDPNADMFEDDEEDEGEEQETLPAGLGEQPDLDLPALDAEEQARD